MANPTKIELSTAISDKFDEITTNTGALSDTEIAECFSGIAGIFNNISPSRKVKQRHIIENVDITFE